MRLQPDRVGPGVPARCGAGQRPVRLVLLLHGVTSTPAEFAPLTGLLDAAAAGPVVVAAPAGWAPPGGRTAWNAGTCCCTARDEGVDDIGYLATVVADAKRRTPVSHVWVLGFSNGAMLGYRLACERTRLPSMRSWPCPARAPWTAPRSGRTMPCRCCTCPAALTSRCPPRACPGPAAWTRCVRHRHDRVRPRLRAL